MVRHFSRSLLRMTGCCSITSHIYIKEGHMSAFLLVYVCICVCLFVCLYVSLYVKCMFFYRAVSSPLDRSKRFTLFLSCDTCSLRNQLGFSGSILARQQLRATTKHSPIHHSLYNSQVLIYTSDSTGESMERTKMPNLRMGSKGGFEPGLTRLRVRHSTGELLLSTVPLFI